MALRALAERRTARTGPLLAVIGGEAPAEHHGRQVRVLDQFRPPLTSEPMAHVELTDAPACTVMNVPPSCLELAA